MPPMDDGGDERYGYLVAGVLFVIAGWGLAVILNVILHDIAPSGGLLLGPVRVFRHWGPYALSTALGGAATGVLGLLLLWIGVRTPRARFVLPGIKYGRPVDDSLSESRDGETAASGHP